MTRISSREFDRDVRRAKREADRAPVIITERGKPAYVLMRHDTYRRLTERQPSIIELLDPGNGGHRFQSAPGRDRSKGTRPRMSFLLALVPVSVGFAKRTQQTQSNGACSTRQDMRRRTIPLEATVSATQGPAR